jgi:Arc/MetJ-type ribon-helix-helix transcriptional regulator
MVKRSEPRRSGAADQPRASDSEKITINLGFIDLGQIDLIVADGFYSNRTDFIRTAIRKQLGEYGDVLKRSVSRNEFALGLHDYSRENLAAVRASGRTIAIRVIGLVRIAADVTPELARSTIASITVRGAVQASPAVRAALADRIF